MLEHALYAHAGIICKMNVVALNTLTRNPGADGLTDIILNVLPHYVKDKADIGKISAVLRIKGLSRRRNEALHACWATPPLVSSRLPVHETHIRSDPADGYVVKQRGT